MFPRLSPDGQMLAWMESSHPNMPWDRISIWVGKISDDGRFWSFAGCFLCFDELQLGVDTNCYITPSDLLNTPMNVQQDRYGDKYNSISCFRFTGDSLVVHHTCVKMEKIGICLHAYTYRSIRNSSCVAGDDDIVESATEPKWSPKGCWGKGASLRPMDAEFATPFWAFGFSSYAFIGNSGDQIVCTYRFLSLVQSCHWILLLLAAIRQKGFQ
nr:uncharacterized protein LOC112291570 [Physcomitrium patens]XP_024394942.1 uncharacterized protein LOC112291570 [Physcomitrium patens]XP_024394948.1 uncharacterized protein LOC112291570 [Physcomitrium patens]XP_024394957.1 uncharacterized protein LOC112291570 [Physcomitrium patens]|eukprot:XP_024394933.1 uncharacterized protein LOC112291570 [Physcomitrella patens]